MTAAKRPPIPRRSDLRKVTQLTVVALQAAADAGLQPTVIDHMLDTLRCLEELKLSLQARTRTPKARALG